MSASLPGRHVLSNKATDTAERGTQTAILLRISLTPFSGSVSTGGIEPPWLMSKHGKQGTLPSQTVPPLFFAAAFPEDNSSQGVNPKSAARSSQEQ